MKAGELIPRRAAALVEEALADSRVVLVNGPRQAGKSTLLQSLVAARGGTYVTLDDRTELRLARADPVGFVERPGLVAIDEVQRGGDPLMLAIKQRVDAENVPGRFLLAGSTRILSVPTLSESLAGRMAIVELWPFAQGEMYGTPDALIDAAFGPLDALRGFDANGIDKESLFGRLCAGGFPEAQLRKGRRRDDFFDDYLATVTERDVAQLRRIGNVGAVPRLVQLLAARTAQELNTTALASDLGIPRATVTTYLPLLDAVFLTHRLPAWTRNVGARTIRHPKVHLVDSGLAAATVGADPTALAAIGHPMAGPLLESFVVGELARQRTWSASRVRLHHYREPAGAEVDCVLERRDGVVVGLEVKAARSVGTDDVRGLERLRDRIGDAFHHGIVLAMIDRAVPLGERLTAVPMSALWEATP